ncbi:MAG: P-II family nitrogen regulator [Planctomycetota bacterium]
MKLIIAYIRPERLGDVKHCLVKADVTKFSVGNARGCGAERGYRERYRGQEVQIDLLPRVRMEIAVNDDHLDRAIEAIVTGARDGESPETVDDTGPGAGKILVIDLVDCVRIRDGVRGTEAVG